MSMSSGLELRFPLLDVDLIRAALNTPEEHKKMGGETGQKKALSMAVPNMPIDLIDKKKRGFTLPINQWMKGTGFLRAQTATEKAWGKLGLDEAMIRAFATKSHRTSKVAHG